MQYLIIINPNTRDANIYINLHGFPETFGTYLAAKSYAEMWELGKYQIVAVCDDSKNYLV